MFIKNSNIFKLIKINRFVHNCYTINVYLYKLFTTLFSYIQCWLWNIKIDKKCKFIGVAILKKKPGSFIKIGKRCNFISSSLGNLIGVNHPCIITTLSSKAEIIIEDNCAFSGATIAAEKSVVIRSNTMIGANTIINDTDWHTEDQRIGKSKDVVIEKNVWIGVNSIVLKGVRIGENSIIGAHSVVTKNIPPNVIAAGNPCKVIKKIF
jgi:acetyltransferase-like isoleucine patch superfamily enzyme